ncbi:MAG: hypothetical protein IJL32_09340 [Oscillospiraceae bacterium]|nr:hypothetical protein [Oscillospiraceae bacterium]
MGIDLTKLEKITPEQAGSVQFDSGLLVKNFNIEDFRQSLLDGQVGVVTKDSFGVNVNRETINILSDLNNVHFDYMEGLVTTKVTTQITFTLASMSITDLAMALGSATIDGDKITIKYEIAAADFQNLALILPLADGGYVIALIPKGYSTGGLSISTSKAAVGGLSCTVTGYKSLADNTIEPIELYRIANPDASLGSITVASAAGTTSGTTKLTITNYTKPAGATYVYKTASGTAPSVTYGQMPDYTWTEWDGTSDITAETGKKITVAAVGQNGALASGNATVTAHS